MSNRCCTPGCTQPRTAHHPRVTEHRRRCRGHSPRRRRSHQRRLRCPSPQLSTPRPARGCSQTHSSTLRSSPPTLHTTARRHHTLSISTSTDATTALQGDCGLPHRMQPRGTPSGWMVQVCVYYRRRKQHGSFQSREDHRETPLRGQDKARWCGCALGGGRRPERESWADHVPSLQHCFFSARDRSHQKDRSGVYLPSVSINRVG